MLSYSYHPLDNGAKQKAFLHTEGHNYNAAKGDIKVCNPKVESDDEYSTSQVALLTGPYYNFEAIESGWAVSIT